MLEKVGVNANVSSIVKGRRDGSRRYGIESLKMLEEGDDPELSPVIDFSVHLDRNGRCYSEENGNALGVL